MHFYQIKVNVCVLFHFLELIQSYLLDFPGGSDGKASAYNAGDPGLIPGSGRSLGEGNGNPLQYSCLENSMDRGAWWATVHRVTKSQIRLSDFTFTFTLGVFLGITCKSGHDAKTDKILQYSSISSMKIDCFVLVYFRVKVKELLGFKIRNGIHFQ